MKRLFFRHPLLALAVLAVLFTYNYCEEHKVANKSATLNVSLDEKRRQICVSKGSAKKIYRFDYPEIGGYDHTSLSLQDEKIIIHHGGTFVESIRMMCEFDTTANKLVLKSMVGVFPERHDPYGLDDVCNITEINRFIDDADLDGDSLFDWLTKRTNCRYEYSELPPLEKLSEDFAESDMLYEYRHGDYIKRYNAIFRTYPISNANHALYNNMGYYLEQAEAYDAAIYLLNAVLEKYPQRAVAHLNIADAYWGNNERAKAKKHYEEYVRLMKKQEKDMDKIPQRVHNRVENIAFFTDRRDGQQYCTVKIGNQRWMAENLNYQTSNGSMCYDNSVDSCNKYGRLYDWKTALTACPSGWHLPSNQEWEELVLFFGEIIQYSKAGTKLKARHGWNDYKGKSGGGTDDYGFSALPGGSCCFNGDTYHIGSHGHWWTATEQEDEDKDYFAYTRDLFECCDFVDEHDQIKESYFSVRCVQN